MTFHLFRNPTPKINELRAHAIRVVSKSGRYNRGAWKSMGTWLAIFFILAGTFCAIWSARLLVDPPEEGKYTAQVVPVGATLVIPEGTFGLKEKLSFPPTYQIEGLTSPASSTYTGLGWGGFSLGVAVVAIGCGFLPRFKHSNEDLMQAYVFLHLSGGLPQDGPDATETGAPVKRTHAQQPSTSTQTGTENTLESEEDSPTSTDEIPREYEDDIYGEATSYDSAGPVTPPPIEWGSGPLQR